MGSTLRSTSRIRIGHGCTIVVCSGSRLSCGLVFLKVDRVAFGVWYYVILQGTICGGSSHRRHCGNGVLWGILCLVIRGLSILCLAAVWSRFDAKLSERGFLVARIERWMIRRIRGRNLEAEQRCLSGAVWWPQRSGWRNRGRGSRGRAVLLHLRPPALLKVKEAQNLLEKHDPQYQQWNEEAKKKERGVEVQGHAGVSTGVVEEQFGQTVNALWPSLIAPPPFLVGEGDNRICWGLRNLDGLTRSCCTKCPFGRTGHQRRVHPKSWEQVGDRKFVAALGEFITRHGGLMFDSARKP